MFQGLYQSLDARWINEPARDSAASHKPYQLTLAQEIGFDIPPTLITNDPDTAREFWRAHPGEVIHKQLVALPETWRETRRLKNEDESFSDTITFAPVLFQRHVPASPICASPSSATGCSPPAPTCAGETIRKTCG